jgi:isopenicillin N synthase-like dioxygenase
MNREVCEEYAKEMEKLACKLMGLIALNLGLPKDKFHGFFKEQTSFIRLNHYPPCPVPDLALGVGRHKDAMALTILAQDDVGGLEVKRKTDGEWLWVKPTPNAYIINVGDIIQVYPFPKTLKLTLTYRINAIVSNVNCFYRYGAMTFMRAWSTGRW